MNGSLVKVRKLARVLDFVVSCTYFATKSGLARYRSLDWEKQSLLSAGHSWEDRVVISSSILPDLEWWLSSPTPIFRSFEACPVTHIITMGASTSADWGAICAQQKVAGTWPTSESYAISLLELQVTVRALQFLEFD
jgi:hypothetical protein